MFEWSWLSCIINTLWLSYHIFKIVLIKYYFRLKFFYRCRFNVQLLTNAFVPKWFQIKDLWQSRIFTAIPQWKKMARYSHLNCHFIPFLLLLSYNCMKSMQIRVNSGPYFPVIGLNTSIYSINQENKDQK